jgi:hypothetical protein
MQGVASHAAGPVQAHFQSIGRDLWGVCMQSVRNPFVTLNLLFTLVLSFGAMDKFGRTGVGDVTHFTDMSFLGSLPLLGVSRVGLDTPVVPGKYLDYDTRCIGDVHDTHVGSTCFDGRLKMGRSGIFGNGFLGLEQNSFNVPHFMWVAVWYAAPISMFLVANEMWSVVQQWMWWGLYMIILAWNVSGLFLMLLWHQSPMYNKIIAFVYFAVSGMLMVSVRETWCVLLRSGGGDTGDVNGTVRGRPMKSRRPDVVTLTHGHSAVHPYVRGKLPFGAKAQGKYEPLGLEEVAPAPAPVRVEVSSRLVGPGDVPDDVAHTFTRTVLLLSEFFFLAPVVSSMAFVMSQDRVVPFDIQARAWQMSLLFGVVVLIEKARKTRLSYVTDTVLLMAAGVALAGVLSSAIPEMFWTMRNRESRPGMAAMYACYAILMLVALVNVAVNLFYVTFVGKDVHHLEEYRDSSVPLKGFDPPETGHTVYSRAVLLMYYFNAVCLVAVKAVLMFVFVLGLAQNRLGV